MTQTQTLHTLLGGINRDVQRRQMSQGAAFADTTGFHLYGHLGITMRLSAAEDVADAQKLLEVLQEYTAIAEVCAEHAGALLFEVQGKRIHLFIPAEAVTPSSVSDVVEFASALTKTVYNRLSERAGKSFDGFKVAVDHGRAIIVTTGTAANASVISLGPAANRPAKQLQHTPAAHLRLPTSMADLLTGKKTYSEWENIEVLKRTAFGLHGWEAEFANLTQKASVTSGQLPQVRFADARYLSSLNGGGVRDPLKVRGFFIRADLDGFSSQVQSAFNEATKSGNDAPIQDLVRRFMTVLRYPGEFRKHISPVIELPWAGDCANILVIADGDYDTAREYVPVKAAAAWHTQGDAEFEPRRKWSEAFGKARWALGIAGGDEEEGCSGVILVATVKGRRRDFLVASGWSVGRSLDAQESDGVKGDDTVIPDIDFKALDAIYRKGFREHGQFWLASKLRTTSIQQSAKSALAHSPAIVVPGISQPVPAARPYGAI